MWIIKPYTRRAGIGRLISNVPIIIINIVILFYLWFNDNIELNQGILIDVYNNGDHIELGLRIYWLLLMYLQIILHRRLFYPFHNMKINMGPL